MAKEQEVKHDISPMRGSTIWSPTCMLRWDFKVTIIDENVGSHEKVLEQLWLSDMGEEQWREIPLKK